MGSEVDFHFLLFLIEENGSNIFRNEKILFLPEVVAFWNLENTYNYIARVNFYRDSPKINFKIYLHLQFWDKSLELESFVLGNKTIYWAGFWFRRQNWKYRILKVAYVG